MSARPDQYDKALDRAATHARDWLAEIPTRAVPPKVDADEVIAALGDLPDGPTDPADVVDLLARAVEPGLMAIGSGRFFGWVMGGTLPAALGADWLVSAWDQNTGMRYPTPGTTGVEEVAATWLLDLLGLPADGRRRVRHRRHDGQLHRPGRRPPARPDPGRLEPRPRRPDRRAEGDRAGRRGPAHDHRRVAALPRARRADPGRGRRAGPDPARGPGRGGRRGRRSADRRAAGRQPALRLVRPVRRVHRDRARRGCLGARRRCLRAVGGGHAGAAAPGRRHGARPTRGAPTRTRR